MSTSVLGQEKFRLPLDIPIYLSANFAELRPNHFHSGIDFKTEGAINKPVYAIEDGYVSRISVSPSGYGLALYIAHTNGHTSVAGHLNKFVPKIADYVINKQYELERFNIDVTLPDSIFPVKRGELVAYSGNTGSSFGPHVHFEIRETNTQKALDPLSFYKYNVEDTRAPEIKGIAIYPKEFYGVVNNSDKPVRESVKLLKEGNYSKLSKTITAWGQIGIGIYAIDRMNETNNIYGVKTVRLLCDGVEVFYSDINSFLFEQTRMINSLTDYDYWYRHKVFYMKSFIEPANYLPFFKSVNNGYINIQEERTYNLQYQLTDLYGNTTEYDFSIEGKKMNIPTPQPCSQSMVWYQDNYYISKDFSLLIPKNYLYDSIGFILNKTESNRYNSLIYSVHNKHIPLDKSGMMKLAILKDTHSNKSQYGVIRIDGKRTSWIGGEYKNGCMYTDIRELGHEYAIDIDTVAPTITPVNPEKWVAKRKISIKLSDDKSGISTYRGTIDGQYILFEKDVKAPAYTYIFDDKRLKKGKHKLVFTAKDRCGNITSYEFDFTY